MGNNNHLRKVDLFRFHELLSCEGWMEGIVPIHAASSRRFRITELIIVSSVHSREGKTLRLKNNGRDPDARNNEFLLLFAIEELGTVSLLPTTIPTG